MRIRPSRSLNDQHGEWCAECLKYFDRDEPRQFHHPLNQKWIRDRFGKEIDFAWVMPAHDMKGCHKPLQIRADYATHQFFKKLDEAKHPDQREKLSRAFHDHGYYWLSALANLDTMRAGIEGTDLEQLSRRCAFALSSLAGVRGGQNLPKILMRHAPSIRNPRIQLNLANLHAARGHEPSAKRELEAFGEMIEGLPKREIATLRPALLRRTAQLSRLPKVASDAVSAAETSYSRDTALVMQGVLAVGCGEFSYAEESLGLLGGRDEISWLYKAEEEFIRALLLILIESKQHEAIYSCLCVAQYIYVVLGLQMSISPYLPFEGPPDRSWDWTPSDVLRTYFGHLGKHRIPKNECYEIRLKAIKDRNLLDRLLNPLNLAGPEDAILTARLKE